MSARIPRMTASERAAEINASHDGAFKLVEDEAFWAEYGIRTAEELDHYLAEQAYVNVYKSIHGIKPRWMSFDTLTTAEISAMTAALAVEEEPVPAQDDGPLTHSPFAKLRI